MMARSPGPPVWRNHSSHSEVGLALEGPDIVHARIPMHDFPGQPVFDRDARFLDPAEAPRSNLLKVIGHYFRDGMNLRLLFYLARDPSRFRPCKNSVHVGFIRG